MNMIITAPASSRGGGHPPLRGRPGGPHHGGESHRVLSSAAEAACCTKDDLSPFVEAGVAAQTLETGRGCHGCEVWSADCSMAIGPAAVSAPALLLAHNHGH
jgi:hypothetical protein